MPTLETVSQSLGDLFLLVASMAIPFVVKRVHDFIAAHTSEKQRNFVVPMMSTAIDWANKQFKDGTTPSREAVASAAVTYMYDHAADAIDALGLDKGSVLTAIQARL